MKATMLAVIGSFVMLLSGCSLGSFGYGNGCFYDRCSGDNYYNCSACTTAGSGCSGCVTSSPCQCTDPSCYNNFEDNCISTPKCCNAFGNIGER